MNSAKTAIMVDSGCDISQEFIEQYDIKVLRLKVLYGDRMYSDGLDIDPLEVYRRFPQEIPTTSTPNMYEVSELVNEIKSEGYEKIIGITISSGLSGTYNAVAMAFEEEDIETFAFDTKNISIGAGLLAMWAAKKLREGWTFEAVKHGLNDKINDSKVFFYMDTLDYLRKGGRISPAVAIVGKALNLKPIISCNEKGTYYTVSKIRGQHKGLEKLMDSLKDYIGDKKAYLAIMNGDGTRYLDVIRARIKEMFPQCEVVVDKQITATMAIHTGPGLIGVGVLFE
ncbi:MAG: DegV family protein [Butyrivibrio crossotus]|nr:DegV family protein [Butyrivibrio crossotus]